MIQFQQSETTAERRRWILVLVDSADGVTGLTGQTGTVFISKNGAAAVASTNSIVEVDSGDMPGHYYIELTAAELNTLGWISITKKTAGSLAFHDRAIVSYNDPFIQAGGFSGSTGSSGTQLTKKQLDYIAERVWKYQFNEEQTAQQILLRAAEEVPTVDLSPIGEQIKSIVIPEIDLTPIIEQIRGISIPQPIDYSRALVAIKEAVAKFKDINTKGVREIVGQINTKMDSANSEIQKAIARSGEVEVGFNNVLKACEELQSKLAEMSDMDKRFENMTSIMQKQKLEEVTDGMNKLLKQILLSITDTKYDILEEIKHDK